MPAPAPLAIVARPGAFPVFATTGAVALVAALAVRGLGLDRFAVPLCLFKNLTGLPCMTCGTTRTLALLGTGDLAGAFVMNPLMAFTGLALGVLAVADLMARAGGRALRFSASAPTAMALRIVVPALILVNWVYLLAMGR